MKAGEAIDETAGNERRAVYDAIASGPRASGPFRLLEDDGAHERVGRTIGMTDDEMSAIKAGGESDYAAAELDVLRYTRAIAEGRPVDDAGYKRLVEVLGEPGVAELATTTLAMVMEVVEVSVPRGEPEPF